MTEHKNIYLALCAAQSGMGKVTKGAVNPAFKSRYADLADVVSVVVPALSEQGIATHHSMMRDEHGLIMRTTLSHGASDTHIHCDVPLIFGKHDMQGMRSATTYAKRIGIESLAGVAPEDDDGNAAVRSAPAKPAKITADEFQQIAALIESTNTDEAKLLKWLGVTDLHDLDAAQAAKALDALRKKVT